MNYRNAKGPFKTLFDLHKVTDGLAVPVKSFQNGWGTVVLTNDHDDIDGDISPAGALLDTVKNDFEEQFLVLNRVSNLLTTRSDSFTAYVLVQGWRGAGTKTPELVAQQRLVMYIDRSAVNPTSRTVKIASMPNN